MNSPLDLVHSCRLSCVRDQLLLQILRSLILSELRLVASLIHALCFSPFLGLLLSLGSCLCRLLDEGTRLYLRHQLDLSAWIILKMISYLFILLPIIEYFHKVDFGALCLCRRWSITLLNLGTSWVLLVIIVKWNPLHNFVVAEVGSWNLVARWQFWQRYWWSLRLWHMMDCVVRGVDHRIWELLHLHLWACRWDAVINVVAQLGKERSWIVVCFVSDFNWALLSHKFTLHLPRQIDLCCLRSSLWAMTQYLRVLQRAHLRRLWVIFEWCWSLVHLVLSTTIVAVSSIWHAQGYRRGYLLREVLKIAIYNLYVLISRLTLIITDLHWSHLFHVFWIEIPCFQFEFL